MTDKKIETLTDKIKIVVTKEHRFGTDAFLLADFANPRMKDKVCDLGTGCGIIPLVMSRKNPPSVIYAVDIQEQAVEQLIESIDISSLDNIVPVCADLKTLWQDAPVDSLDVVTCNPPYKAEKAGIESELTAQRIARHEILCNINDVCRAGARLLKFGGRLCICNRPERLCDVILAMKNNGIEPKQIRFVAKKPSEAPWLFLIEGKKGSKPFLKVLPELYIQNGTDGDFSEELKTIYKGERKSNEG